MGAAASVEDLPEALKEEYERVKDTMDDNAIRDHLTNFQDLSGDRKEQRDLHPSSKDGVAVSARGATEEESKFLQSVYEGEQTLNFYTLDVENGPCLNAVVQPPSADARGLKVALFMHGVGDDRCWVYWVQLFSSLSQAGFHCVAIDSPGFGKSTGSVDRTTDAQMLVRLLYALGVPAGSGCVHAVGDGMGAATIIRALCAFPQMFSHNHMLINCQIGEVPSNLTEVLRKKGGHILYLICEGFSLDDPLHALSSNAQMFNWSQTAPELWSPVPLKCPGRNSTLKSAKSETYLVGEQRGGLAFFGSTGRPKGSKVYVLIPSEEMVGEVVGFLSAPRAATRHGVEQGVKKTALELGKQNEHFKVYVRSRPMLSREVEAGCGKTLKVTDVEDFPRTPPPQRVFLSDPRVISGPTGGGLIRGKFVFDRVFEESASQQAVFDSTAGPMVGNVLQGVNATLFAYGQTGTGKTYTVSGEEDGRGGGGLLPRIVRELFSGLAVARSEEGSDPAGEQKEVRYSYIQLYNGEFLDLLAPGILGDGGDGGEANLRLVENAADPNAFMRVEGARELTATSAEQLLSNVATGSQYRESGSTSMNDSSSRSHAVLLLNLVPAGAPPDARGTFFSIVDLAGSERVKKSGAMGTRFTEAVSINSSLSALARVVAALVEHGGKRGSFIPYRDSKLTHLLKNGLGGNSKTALICCITPADDSVDETLRTLEFAMNASHVKNTVAMADKKAKAAGAREAIVEAGHTPEFSGEADSRRTVIPTSAGGDISCHGMGNWSSSSEDVAPLVICLHSFHKPGDTLSFGSAAAALGFRVLCPELPRHGKTAGDKVKSESELEMVKKNGPVAVLKQLLDWLGVVKAIFLGRDWGAVLALQMASKHPTRVSHLLLENKGGQAGGDLSLQRSCIQNRVQRTGLKIPPCFHGHEGFGILLDTSVQKKATGVAGKVLLLWPTSKKKQLGEKQHNTYGEDMKRAWDLQLVDNGGSKKKKFSDNDVVTAFSEFLREHVLPT